MALWRDKNRLDYQLGAFRLDPTERQLVRSGQPLPLTPKAFDTLLTSVEHHGHLVEKDDLMKLVWAGSFVEEANLPRCVHTLRRRLGEDHTGHKYTETVPELGYRFVAEVRVIEDGDGAAAGQDSIARS